MDKVNERGQTLQQFLAEYDETKYRRPSNTVDMILMTVSEGQLKVLLIRRKDHPFIHDWALPGGFVNFDEDLDTAVLRELKEETSMEDNNYFLQLYTFGAVDRDPRTRIISTAYLSMTPESNIRHAKAGDDAADSAWYTITKTTQRMDDNERYSILSLVNEEKNVHMHYGVTDKAKDNYMEVRSDLLPDSDAQLAADHIKAINMAIDLLRNRAGSTGILFNLLGKEFTLRELQNVYEAVIGHKVDTGNFRRDIRKMLRPTGKTSSTYGKRAALFSFNPMFEYLKENL